ncbi:hypothetical protein BGZ57DRAFT_896539 [Hyaloscypha finlandica]|nr:hypothetical protein BGZ57DRAFT_896539 [Hyaloscypha finlandica]
MAQNSRAVLLGAIAFLSLKMRISPFSRNIQSISSRVQSSLIVCSTAKKVAPGDIIILHEDDYEFNFFDVVGDALTPWRPGPRGRQESCGLASHHNVQ